MKNIITEIEQKMSGILNNEQMEYLHRVLRYFLDKDDLSDTEEITNEKLLSTFISAKKLEGCSDRTVTYYENTIKNMMLILPKNVKQIETDDLREYLSNYQMKGTVSKITIDNVRRVLSSFFAWLEDEICNLSLTE